MRPAERIIVFAGLLLAIMLGLGSHGSAGAAVAAPPAAEGFRLATVDTFTIIEQIMLKPDLKKAREDVASSWSAKADAAERELTDMQNTLRTLQPSDPQAEPTIKRYQDLQARYQKLAEDRQTEVEQVNSSQLINAFKQVTQAANAVADRLGYTHVLSSRPPDYKLEPPTVGAALQELLARPLIRSPAADDITSQVTAELKLGQ